MSFIKELKRRNVFRVAIAYAIAAWLLIEITATTFPILKLPDWSVTLVTVLVLIGFPLALIFAWAYELTPEGLKKEKDVDRSESVTHITGRKLDFAIITALVLALVYFAYDEFVIEPAQESEAAPEVIATEVQQSIAVLPFVNISDDSDHFADGLSEELMNLLAKIPNLKVAGRTSSFAFKGQNPDFREIGAALNVEHVLEGSIRRSGERLRVTAQLIKVEDGFHIWSETYDREMADIFDIQDDVASAITGELKLRLVPPANRPTENIDAYAIYLEALAMWRQGTASTSDIVAYLDRALEFDPSFAKAHELKAMAYWDGAGSELDKPSLGRLVYESAVAALELDPTLIGARTFTVLASPNEWNWSIEFDAIEAAFKATHDEFNMLLILCYDLHMVGYREEALQCAKRLVELEPLSTGAHWRVGLALSSLGRREEARESWQRAVDLGDSESPWNILLDYLVAAEYEAAIKTLEIMPAWNPSDARHFIESVADPETGKAFLDAWINDAIPNAADINEANLIYVWYLAFGHMDDYWRVIEDYESQTDSAWTNADMLEQFGSAYPQSGYVQHPKYISYGNRWGLAELWEKRGPPDMCSKINGQWTCE